MRSISLALFAVLSLIVGNFDLEAQIVPKLLLTPQRLRRLQRDRERQTVRWANFEHRVQTAPNSSERGFELALYYAVTQDPNRAKEAGQWATDHPCEIRQVALIADWAGTPLPQASKGCPSSHANAITGMRDSLFLGVASGDAPKVPPDFLAEVSRTGLRTPEQLYSAVELIDAVRSTQRHDLREAASSFFFNLPSRFLLSLPQSQLTDPSWQTHAAALALVTLDPNLEGSQFLQGWAIEDQQMIGDGPGVAYEFLWANPYLPGVSYQNMEPWLYEEDEGHLIARSDWTDKACRIEIAEKKVQGQNCPPEWQSEPVVFSRLALIPMTSHCRELSGQSGANSTTILWKLNPDAKLTYSEDGKGQTRTADRSGMWRVSAELHGKVCASR